MKSKGKTRPDATLGAYLNGVLALASVCSEPASRSDIAAAVYAGADFPRAFVRDYRLRTPLTLSESPETFRTALTQWLGINRELADKTAALFERELGSAQRVLRAECEDALLRDLSSSERGFGAFYTTEDVFFVVFPEHTIAFLTGNFD